MEETKRYEQYMYSYPHKRAYGPLFPQTVRRAFENYAGQDMSLYVHVPSCSSKCGYCNLFSVASAEESLRERYTQAVIRQAKQYGSLLLSCGGLPAAGMQNVGQVIFGGGTPFILTEDQFERLFLAMERLGYEDSRLRGFDMETSPRETTKEKLQYLNSRGMKRLSIGIQSFHDEELHRVLRQHDSRTCHEALRLIADHRPDCLNLDLIYGIPGQTMETWADSLNQALAYEPDELFLYPLYVREGTLLYGRMEADETQQYHMYRYAAKHLGEIGYLQTSMRRFVKNSAWKEAEEDGKSGCGFERTLSLGCGGRSYAGNLHFCEPYEAEAGKCRSVLNEFVEKDDFLTGLKGYVLNEDEEMRRFVIKNLGFYRGVSAGEFYSHFGRDLYMCYAPLWDRLLDGQLVEDRGGRMVLTVKGLGDSDRILALWISDEVDRSRKK